MKREESKPLEAKLPPDHEFAALIAEAYQVFACEKPTDTGVCKQCCMDPEIEAVFFAPTIENLPLRHLEEWYFALPDEEFDQHIWRYLLPRILEVLVAGGGLAGFGIALSLNRFPTGVHENWSKEEWDVLNRFQKGFLRRALVAKQRPFDDVLCMFGLAGWPQEGLFEQVLNFSPHALAERLWKDWCRIPKPRVSVSVFWEEEARREAKAFYRSKELFQKMSDLACDNQTPPELAERALAVANVIETETKWY